VKGHLGRCPYFLLNDNMEHTQIDHPITRKSLAALYQVKVETLRIWLKNVEIKRSYRLERTQLDLLFELYGKPSLITYTKKSSTLPKTSGPDQLLQKSADDKVTLRFPLRRKQLGKIFQVDTRTIQRWFEDIEISHSETLSPKELKRFFHRYGLPNEYRLGF
jgi:hypothetical protein